MPIPLKKHSVKDFLIIGEYDQGDEAIISYDDLYDYLEKRNIKMTEKCGYMILTPTPLHNGGLWCNNNVPCPAHGDWKKLKVKKQ